MSVRCVVVDDERPARERMKRLLWGLEGVELVGEAENGLVALEVLASTHPDVVLLDIEMPELDGLEVAAALGPNAPALIFVTAYDQHALKAFELSAVDYLVKPVAADRLKAALAKTRKRRTSTDLNSLAAQLRPNPPTMMAVRCGARFVVFEPARVAAILSKDHYSAIFVDGKELLADDSMNALADRFDPQKFIRVHRGAIVNLAFLKELIHEGDRRYVAVLTHPLGLKVPISRDRLPELKSKLGL